MAKDNAKDNFTEFDVIRDVPDGVVIAVLTYRTRPSGERMYSYSFMREFDDGGSMRRTCWLNARHADAVARLLPRIKARLSEYERASEPTHARAR
jgi:hypothetical protein